MRIGIRDLAGATGHYAVRLDDLAAARDVDPGKYRLGLGQDEFGFPAPDEDAVTMGAAAAFTLLERREGSRIRTLLFATESGVDQSKAAGLWVHRLLGLSPGVRVAEVKQACYGGTAALQAAIGLVLRRPEEEVLVIASDIARYALGSSGEPTQGAAAVAMIVGAEPELLEIEPLSGLAAHALDDFWRPIDADVPRVDGRLSVSAYLESLSASWADLQARGGPGLHELDRFIAHQPFTKMAIKARDRLAEAAGAPVPEAGIETSTRYNRRLGNGYTASLYTALAALLDEDPDLAGRRIGLFSYGSGSQGEFFTGIGGPGLIAHGGRAGASGLRAALDAREPLPIDRYRLLHRTAPRGSADRVTPHVTAGPFRFAGVRDGARRYERRGANRG